MSCTHKTCFSYIFFVSKVFDLCRDVDSILKIAGLFHTTLCFFVCFFQKALFVMLRLALEDHRFLAEIKILTSHVEALSLQAVKRYVLLYREATCQPSCTVVQLAVRSNLLDFAPKIQDSSLARLVVAAYGLSENKSARGTMNYSYNTPSCAGICAEGLGCCPTCCKSKFAGI